MAQRLALLEQLIDASKVIAMQLDPFEATASIIRESCRLLQCDRATLFTLDRTRNELVLLVAEGAREIRLPVGAGIAGTVAATGEIINIPDAYQVRYPATALLRYCATYVLTAARRAAYAVCSSALPGESCACSCACSCSCWPPACLAPTAHCPYAHPFPPLPIAPVPDPT